MFQKGGTIIYFFQAGLIRQSFISCVQIKSWAEKALEKLNFMLNRNINEHVGFQHRVPLDINLL
jgi:hypothetical protein